MNQVKYLFEIKGNVVYVVVFDMVVLEVICLMVECWIGVLLVMCGEQLVGIVLECDYVCKVILQGWFFGGILVFEIMSVLFVIVGLDIEVLECMCLCMYSCICYLLVVEGNVVVGVILIGDLVKVVIDEQVEQIE